MHRVFISFFGAYPLLWVLIIVFILLTGVRKGISYLRGKYDILKSFEMNYSKTSNLSTFIESIPSIKMYYREVFIL